MAQQTEVAQLYYTLGARTDASTQSVVTEQTNALDQLEAVAKEAGVPIGALRAAVAELTDEVEQKLRAAVSQLGAEMDATGISAAVLAQQTEAISEATAESISGLTQQVRLYGQGTQIAATRQQALAALASIEAQLKGRLDAGNLSLEQRIRLENALAQTQATTTAALARTSGAVVATQAATKTGAQAVKDFGERWSGTALNVVVAASSIASSGNASAGSLKSLLLGATSLAGFLGAGGALVTASVVAANAIVSVFARAREEAQKLKDETRKLLDDLQDRGDISGLNARALALQKGTPSKDFKDGIESLTKQLREADMALTILAQNGAKRAAELKQSLGSTSAMGAKTGAVVSPLADVYTATKRDRDRIKKELDAAVAEVEDIKRRVLARGPATPASPPLPVITTVQGPKSTAADLKKLQDAAKEQAAAFKTIEDSFSALLTKATEGQITVDAFSESVAKLRQEFGGITKPTAEQAASFDLLNTAAEHVQSLLSNFATDKAQKELDELMASLTPSVVDDVRIAYEKFAEQLSRSGFSDADVAPLLAMKDAIGDVAIGMEQLDARIQGIKDTAISSFDAQLGLSSLLQEVEAQLSNLQTLEALSGPSEAASVRIAGLVAQIKKLKAEIAALDGNKKSGSSDEALSQRAIDDARKIGRAIEDVGRITLSAAGAFGVLSNEAQKALAASIDVAAGLGRVFAGDAAGGGAQAASGAINLLAQAFGKDPETAQRRREHGENLQALNRIAKNTGDLLGISMSGTGIASIRSAVGDLLKLTGNAGGFRKFGDGPLRGINEADYLSKATGLSFSEIEALAKSLNITLNGTKESYVAFLDALKQLDLESYTKGFTGQLRKLEIEARLDPAAFEGIDGLLKRLQVLTGPDGAPAIAAALKDLDVTTSEGRGQAIANLTEKLRNLSSLDVSDLGGLSLDQFVEEILATIEKLRDLDPTPAEKFSKALEAFGVAAEFGALTAEQKLTKVRDLFATLFPDLAASLDTSSAEAFKASVRGIIEGFSADGELTAAEQAQIDVLRLLTGAFDDATTEAEQLAEKARQAMLEARALVFTLADAFIQVNDITDPVEILQVKAKALAKAFPELSDALGEFDLKTQEGRDALEAWIRSVVESPDALKAMAESLGLSVDELIGQLLGLESAADSAATKVATLADKLSSAFDEVQFGIDLEGISDPIERLKRTVDGIAGLIPEIDAALADFDPKDAASRAEAERRLVALGNTTTDPAVRRAILSLLNQIRGIPKADGGASASDGTGDGRVTTRPQNVDARFSAFASATVGQVDSMLTMLTRIQENTKTVADFYLRGAGGVRAPVLPQLPQLVASATMGGGGLIVNVYATINIGAGVGAETARVALDEGGTRIRRQIEDIVETGGAKRLIRSQRSRGVPLQT